MGVHYLKKPMADAGKDESIKKFLMRYTVGFVVFFTFPLIVVSFFAGKGEVLVDAEGEYQLGFAQTYLETVALFTPSAFLLFMLLSVVIIGVVSWLTYGMGTGIKKALEAVVVGVGFLVIGYWLFTSSIVNALENNYRQATGDDYATLEVVDVVWFNSSMLFAIAVVWINFLLEAVRFKKTMAQF